MAGTSRSVLRTASAAAVVLLVAAGCGGSARPHSTARVLPRELARTWASQADAVATAAAAGNSCRAQQLAGSLRDEIITAEGKIPTRLRQPLLVGVNSLADRIVCKPVAVTPQHPPKHPKAPTAPEPHGHHGHGNDKGKHQ